MKDPKPLPPREEYDFSAINPEEIDAACWWEYLRESSRARAAVEIYRNSDRLLPADIEPIRDITGTMLLSLLSHVDGFPATPWLSLSEADRTSATLFIRGELAPAAWITPDAYIANKSEVKPGAPPFQQCLEVRLPILGGSPRALGTTRRSILLTVNWEANNEQILETIAQWLKKNRPGECANTKRRPILTGGNKKFTSQYADAIRWLGPRRLHAALGKWPAVAAQMGGGVDGPLASKLAAKARRIVDWLDGKKTK